MFCFDSAGSTHPSWPRDGTGSGKRKSHPNVGNASVPPSIFNLCVENCNFHLRIVQDEGVTWCRFSTTPRGKDQAGSVRHLQPHNFSPIIAFNFWLLLPLGRAQSPGRPGSGYGQRFLSWSCRVERSLSPAARKTHMNCRGKEVTEDATQEDISRCLLENCCPVQGWGLGSLMTPGADGLCSGVIVR